MNITVLHSFIIIIKVKCRDGLLFHHWPNIYAVTLKTGMNYRIICGLLWFTTLCMQFSLTSYCISCDLQNILEMLCHCSSIFLSCYICTHSIGHICLKTFISNYFIILIIIDAEFLLSFPMATL